MTIPIETVVKNALTQNGYPYTWGGKTHNPTPHGGMDCSGLVQWATWKAGHELAGGSWQQLTACKNAGLEIPVSEGIATRGALLFIPANGADHVAISLGNGMTIEARGTAWGIGSWPAANRFQTAAKIPGFDYTQGDAMAPARLVRDPDTQRVYLQTLGDGHLYWVPDATPDLQAEETDFGQPKNLTGSYLKGFPGYIP